MITYLYAILSRYAILSKPDLSENSIQRFTRTRMLTPRKNTFFHMLMITYLYAVLLRYAIPIILMPYQVNQTRPEIQSED